MSISLEAYGLAGQLLDEWLNGRNEVKLADAARNLDRLALSALSCAGATAATVRDLHHNNGQRLIAGLLRRRGWRKVGMSGSGYDREPLYRKEPAR